MNDPELLHAWTTRRDESAFAELVRRHLPLVLASAMRQVRNPELAQDISQSVFLVLSRKAGSLVNRPVLAGWLLRTTRFVAARALRAECRRTHHETAAAMDLVNPDSCTLPEHWGEVEPHLDAALDELSARDRDALALRFLEGRPLRAVGESLGIGEDAAKKRVQRAVERIRIFLARKGVVLSAGALIGLLTQIPVAAAPADLANRMTATVVTETANPTAMALATGAIRDWFFVRLRAFLPWAVAGLMLIIASVRLAAPATANVASVEAEATTGGAAATASVEPPAAILTGIDGSQPGPSAIVLNVRSAADNRPLTADVLVGHWHSRTRVEFQELRTDAAGNAQVPLDGANLREAIVTISAAGHVPIEARWQRHELVDPVLLYSVRLQPGQHFAGVVQDEEGAPVADARIQFAGPWGESPERERIRFIPSQTGVNSDAAGRFRSDQLPRLNGLGAMSYTVSHPQFVRARIVVDGPEALATNQRVILHRGTLLTGRVTNSEDIPVSNASVREASNLEGSERRTTTAEDGTFTLGPFAPGTVEVHASAAGFKSADRTAPVSTNEVSIRLDANDGSEAADDGPPESITRLSGTVVDAHSGTPVSKFRVRMRSDGGPIERFLGEGHSGRFDWPVDLAFVRTLALEVDAEGFAPSESDTRPASGAAQSFEFRLTPGGTARGRVLAPDGQPVSGAVIGLTGATMGFFLRDGLAFSGNLAPSTRTAEDGSFSIRLRTRTEMLFAVHPLGYVVVSAEGATNCLITLQPWGTIEGTLLVGGRPAAGQTVALRHWMPDDDAPVGPDLEGTARSDSEGRFRFNKVPPGSAAVSRYFNFNRSGLGPTGSGPRHRVEVPAGGVAEVVMESAGRPVTGRFVLEHPVSGYDWRDDLQSLEDVSTIQPIRRGSGSGEYADSLKEARAFTRREQASRKYFPVIQSDGSFLIDEVPPGNYQLKLRISSPPKDDEDSFFRKQLGALTKEITVAGPESGELTEPLDLGTILIPIK